MDAIRHTTDRGEKSITDPEAQIIDQTGAPIARARQQLYVRAPREDPPPER
ncbi:hypothetical protein [Nocardia jiangxiensis]|uniref:Uncharacterized protein n=1 Tax=Nocardia jiangxiensis TaxID=282685 RepID=A0ABW6S2Y9_9NOCA|nr:hypothetical protein [Nocardia jiangxiensis]